MHLYMLAETTLGKPEFSSLHSGLELVSLVVLCGIVIAASYFVTKFIAAKQFGAGRESNFKVIDVYRISQNKVIQLLQVGEKYIVIAICKDSVTVLTELTKDQITHVNMNSNQTVNFKEILSGILPKKDIKTTEKVDIHEEDY